MIITRCDRLPQIHICQAELGDYLGDIACRVQKVQISPAANYAHALTGAGGLFESDDGMACGNASLNDVFSR